MSCLIVDDEPLCRTHLRRLAESIDGLTIVGEANSVDSALQAIEANQPDIILLDVQLGEQSGFNVLSRLRTQPKIVFVTGHHEYAVRAFEVDAVDFLLKPVSAERLQKCIDKLARETILSPVRDDLTSNNDLAILELGFSGFFASVRDIVLVESSNHHSKITLDSGRTCLVRRSMREWVRLLPANKFQPLDRSFLVNLEHVHTVDCSSRGAVLTLGSNQTPLTIGRTAARRLRELLRGDANSED
jgi:two-component system LytT family response regulator